MGKLTTILTTSLAILTALLPIAMDDTVRLVLTALFGIAAGLTAALGSAPDRKLSVLGVIAILIGTVSAPEITSLTTSVLGTEYAELFARIAQVGGAVLAALGQPIWTPTIPK